MGDAAVARPNLPQFEPGYDFYKMRTLVDELNRWIDTVESGESGAGGGGGGGGFEGEHNDLAGRGAANAHPIVAITGLQAALDALLTLVAQNGAAITINDGRITILEDEILVANAQRVDDTTSSTVYYFGEAVPGSLESEPVWRLSRGTFITPGEDDFELEWADGNNSFDNVWDDRLAGSYS